MVETILVGARDYKKWTTILGGVYGLLSQNPKRCCILGASQTLLQLLDEDPSHIAIKRAVEIVKKYPNITQGVAIGIQEETGSITPVYHIAARKFARADNTGFSLRQMKLLVSNLDTDTDTVKSLAGFLSPFLNSK